MKEKVVQFNEYILADFISFIKPNISVIVTNLQQLLTLGQAAQEAILTISKDYHKRLQTLITDYKNSLTLLESSAIKGASEITETSKSSTSQQDRRFHAASKAATVQDEGNKKT